MVTWNRWLAGCGIDTVKVVVTAVWAGRRRQAMKIKMQRREFRRWSMRRVYAIAGGAVNVDSIDIRQTRDMDKRHENDEAHVR